MYIYIYIYIYIDAIYIYSNPIKILVVRYISPCFQATKNRWIWSPKKCPNLSIRCRAFIQKTWKEQWESQRRFPIHGATEFTESFELFRWKKPKMLLGMFFFVTPIYCVLGRIGWDEHILGMRWKLWTPAMIVWWDMMMRCMKKI